MVFMVKYVVVAIMQDNGLVIVGDAVDEVVLVELRIEKGFLVCISSRELASGSGTSGVAVRKRFFSVYIFPGASIWIR